MKRVLPLIIALLSITFINAQTIYVDADATGSNNGTSWQNAYTNLSTAIDAAQSGNQLWVAAGVYYPTSQPNYAVGSADQRFNHFTLKNGVTLYGGFAGDETAVSQRDLVAYKTVLSGDIDQNDNVGDDGYVTKHTDVVGSNSLKLFYFPTNTDVDTTAVLDGFILAGAVADNDVFPYMGGAAMLCQGASPKVVNCEFYGNYAKADGGAIWINESSMIIENCTFSGNYSESHAGAVNFNNTSAKLIGCTFKSNTGKYGGAVFIEQGDDVSIIEDCLFENNEALDNGGGISIANARVLMKNTSFLDNSAASWGGGVVFFANCDVDIINCTINSNYAGTWGGGIGAASWEDDQRCNIRIYNSKIQGNETGEFYGGGLGLSKNASCKVYNSLFSGNKVPLKPTNEGGGAVTVERTSSFEAYNCTFVANNNSDGTNKMADFRVVNDGSSFTMYNSIIWDYHGEFYTSGAVDINIYNSRSVVYKDVNGNTDENPIFITNPGNITVPSTDGDYSLWGNSPVNNKGSNAYLPKDKWDLDNDGDTDEPIPYDLNGNQRVFAGVVDLGCFEQQFANSAGNALTVWQDQNLTINNNLKLNSTDFTIEMWVFPREDVGMDGGYYNLCGNKSPEVAALNRAPSLYIFQYDRIHYGYGDGTNWNSGDTEKALKTGQWNHIAMTFRNSDNTLTLYANGKQLETLSVTGEVAATSLDRINADKNFKGFIDEFRVWKKELTLEELKANMNKTLSGNEGNLELYYSFDQVTGGDIEDQAGSYNGTLTSAGLLNSDAIFTPILKPVTNIGIDNFTINWNAVPNVQEYYIDVALDKDFNNTVLSNQPTSGATTYTVNGLSKGTVYYYKVNVQTNDNEWGRQYAHTATKMNPPGNAFEFDGSTYIEANDVCKYEFTETTIECWISTTNRRQAVWACNTSAGKNNYILFTETDGHLLVAQQEPDGTVKDLEFGDTAIISSGWNHVAVTIGSDVNHTVNIYVNGILKGSGNGLADAFPYGSTLSIGQEFDGANPSDFYNGKMDEFRVWNKALTGAEINANMDNTLAGNENNLVTYYNFDLQTGTKVIDNANVFDGTIEGETNWIESTVSLNDFAATASAETTSGFSLIWGAVAGASSYTVDVATDAQFANLVKTADNATDTTYDATGLNEGTKYYFRVNSNNSKTSQVNYTNTLMTVPGNALYLDGKDDFVEANQIAEQGNKANATMECWAYLDPTETHGRFLAINTSSGGNKYLLSYQSAEGYCLYKEKSGGSKVTIASNNHTKGAWVHLAVSMSVGATKFYMNGKLVGETSNCESPLYTGNQISFGQEYDGTKQGDFLKGAIDEVRFWDDIRTQTEIRATMHKKLTGNEENLLAYYDFDQLSGNTVADKVNGIDANIISNPQWVSSDAIITPLVSTDKITDASIELTWFTVDNATDYKIEVATDKDFQNIITTVASNDTTYTVTGLSQNTEYYIHVASKTTGWSAWSAIQKVSTLLTPPGNALEFDGVDGMVDVGQVMSSNWNTITLESWVKIPDEQNPIKWGRIVSNFAASGGFGMNLTKFSDKMNHVRFEFMSAAGSQVALDSDIPVDDNKWHHIAGVYDNDKMYIYIDGELNIELDVANDLEIKQSGENCGFGNQYDGGNWQPMKGTLDEIRIWNTARTPAQLKEFAHKTLNGDEIGLVAYYNVDKAEGTTFKDEAGNFDGTMSGGVTWAESKALITPFLSDATAIANTGFTANWQAVPNATKYLVRVATDKLLTQPVEGLDSIVLGNVTTYNVTGLTENTNYYYGVMSYTDRYSAWSPGSSTVKTTGATSGELAVNLSGDANYIDISAYIGKVAGKNAGAVTGWFKTNEKGVIYSLKGDATNYSYIKVGDVNGTYDDESFSYWLRDADNLELWMIVRKGNDFYTDNSWHHFAVITGDGNNRILIDGEEQEVYFDSGTTQTQEFSDISVTSDLFLGENFSGSLDEIAIYKNPLTNNEVLERAHKKLTGSEIGLVSYYTFDNSNAADSSGFGRDGSIQGTVSYERANVLTTPFLSNTVAGVTVADLNWKTITGATNYVVDVATDVNMQNRVVNNISTTATTYHIDNLDKNQKYFYRVKAKVDGQWSEYSTVRGINLLPGKCLSLAGSDQYAVINNPVTEDFTLELWIKPEPTAYTGGDYVFYGGDGLVSGEISGKKNDFGLSFKNNRVVFGVGDEANGVDFSIVSDSCIQTNVWNHIAATREMSTGIIKLYVNGKLKAEQTTTSKAPLTAPTDLIIGALYDNSNIWDKYTGEIDELRIWNKVCSQDEIRANMNLSEPEGASEHYIAHYTFDEIHEGTTIKDMALQNDATLKGDATIANSEGVITPITLEATNVTLGSFTINLNDIESAQSFEVEIAYDETFVPPLALHENIGKTTSYNAEGLCPGVKYYYRARAIYNEATISSWSTSDTVWTVNQDAVISNFEATEGDYSQNLKLTWECTNDYLIDNFEIKRSLAGEDNFKELATVENNTELFQYIDTLALPGTYYEYTIKGISHCYNNNTNIETSNVGFNIPTLELSKEINSATQEAYIRLDYKYSGDFCKGVEIQRTNTETGITQTFQEVKDSLVYRDGAVELCVPYTYQLVAKTYDFNDVKSHTKAFTLEEDIFDAIDTLDASKGYFDNKIALNWVSYKQNIIDEYQISRRKYATGNSWQVVKIIDRGSTQVWIDEDANAGEYYEYLIVGYGTCGETQLRTDSVISVGFRQPEGAMYGQVSYAGGNPVFDVKLTVGYEDDTKVQGNCLSFAGNDSLKINPVNTFDFTEGKTVEMWIRPNSLDNGFILYKNSGLIIEYAASGVLSAFSNAALSEYNIKTDANNVWNDNSWNHIAISADANNLNLLVNGVNVATHNAATNLVFDTTIVALGYSGFIDELRVWNTMRSDSVINRYKGLMLSRDLDNIVTNLRFDEKAGNFAFDHSRNSDEPNKSHATIYGANWSDAIPSLATLSLGALTELSGNYQAKGIWFKGSGDTYSITPSFGVHEFNPATKSMLISENALVYSSQDFTDISSFIVTGNVKYVGANFPVEAVMLSVDGQVVISTEGSPITTDTDGNFSIEVPIGEHFISVTKLNHTFSKGYFPPKDTQGEPTYHLFDNPVSGIQFIDSTFMTVAGRIVGGTIEGDKEIGFGKSVNNLGVCDFTVKAVKGHPIANTTETTITVTTDAATGEYEVKLFPEHYQFVVDASHNIGNSTYEFNSIDDLTVINLADPMLESTATDTATLMNIVGNDTTYHDTVYNYMYHLKRNWIYRSVPTIEVVSKNNNKYIYDSILYVQDANKDTVAFTLINADGSDKLDYPAFTKGAFYTAIVNVFEEYENIDNSSIDRVPVQDGKITVINGCATYPAPVDYAIENGQVVYDFIGGFPNPTKDDLHPELSYTKTFEIHSYTGDGDAMHSQWPEGGLFRAYVFGGIPTGQNFVTQGPDQVDFILRDPPGSNSSAYFESGFTVSNSTSNSFDNSSSVNTSLEIDLGWEITTFVGFGAGIISTNEQVANFEAGIGFESNYSGGHSHEQTTTFTQSYSTSDDPAYVGDMGDLFFGHSTNITYGVSNCIGIIPAGTGEENLGTDVDGFTVGLDKGLNLGLTFGTSFMFTQNHIENYLIPDLEMFYEKLLAEGNADSADYYMQQANLWRKTLAQNEYQKYWAIKMKNVFDENKNLSFDAGAIYEESMESEITETSFSSFEFSINTSVSTELGFEAFGMGSTWKMDTETSSSTSTETENSTTNSTTVGYILNDGDQGDYFSVDVLKDPFGNGPIFSTLGGQSACPYEGGTTVEYADYLDAWHPSDFNNEFQLNYPTMQIEVPKISAENAIVAGVPDNEPAVFVLKLSNQSEVNADNWFTLELDAASNPYGAKLKMDGAAIINGVSIMIPGGTTLTKTLELEKGQDAINDYEGINLILHSQCQFDPTDDVDDIADTVTITANFVPTCTDIEVLNPSDNWLINVDANDVMPVKLGGYNINHGTFEKIAFQYKAESASTFNTVAMFFNDTTDYGIYSGEKFKINGSDVMFYDWDMSALQDRTYQIRAVSVCTDGSTTESNELTGTLDGNRPQVFGTPSPADGILDLNDDIMISFNEPIEDGLVTSYNIDIQGVLNGAEINHGISIALDGAGDFANTTDGINIKDASFTVEFWLRKQTGDTGTVISQGTIDNEYLGIYFADDSLKVTNGLVTVGGVNNFDDANWHHYAVAYNSTTNNLAIYIDDQLVTEKPFEATKAQGSVLFGKSALTNADYFTGNIHDVRIWRKAVSYTDIIQNMNKSLVGNEFGLLAYYPIDEAQGVLLKDKVHSRNATLTGTWAVEPSSSAYAFNGTNQALSFNAGAIPIGNEMDMTIEMWFKGSAQNGEATLFSNGKADVDGYNPAKVVNINLTATGNIKVINNGQSLLSTNSYTDDTWHHIAFVLNRRGYASLYVDAEKVASTTAPAFGSMESATAYIGALGYLDNSLANQLSNYFNGVIDEVRIWNLAKTQEQIEMYQNNRLSGTEIGLKAYFPFETYEEVMGVMLSASTLDDQAIDPYSGYGSNYCGTLTVFGTDSITNISPNIKRERAKSKVNFDFVINNDQIIITPTDNLALIEKCVLEITVQNIQDKHGNTLASPVTWTAYIKKNQVVWGDDLFTFNKEMSETLSFTSTVINSGGTQQTFTISNLPSWLTASPVSGALNPDSKIEIEFTVSDGLNIGNYTEDIFLESASGYNERLSLNLNVFKQAPNWVVDETAYQNSMNIIAQLSIKNIISNDKNDMIGVFVGDVCRGVCKLEYKTNYDAYFAFVVVYGNQIGEELSYRVWDASEGKIYSDVSPTYNFEPNQFYGNMATPIVFNAGGKLNNSINLNKGWNWLSFNLNMDDASINTVFDGLSLIEGDVIKHAELFTAYDAPSTTWFGSLNNVEIGKLYRAKIQNGGELKYMGEETKSSDFTIELVNGWNRIGFIPAVNVTVNEALAGFEPQINDVVKSQYQFAMYDGYEWIGSMNYMEQGKGYMYKSENTDTITFVYPDITAFNKKSSLKDINPEASEYGVKAGNYEYAMSVVAQLNGSNIPDNILIGAFINNELRGIASVVNTNGLNNYSFITVYGSGSEIDQIISFKLIANNKTIEIEGNSLFDGNNIDGSLSMPVELNVGNALSIINSTENELAVYPNPFKTEVSVNYNLTADTDVVIEVYNVLGKKLNILYNGTLTAGNHVLKWDGSTFDGEIISQGVYFIHIKLNESINVIRIIKE